MALTKAPETEGENQDISVETTFTVNVTDRIDMLFFPVFLFVIFGFCLLSGWMLFYVESLSGLWNRFS